MYKLARVSAPAKAILCGEHAVVYGEDAIAFGVNLKCYADIYTSNKSHQSNYIILKIHLLNLLLQIHFNKQILQIASKLSKNTQKYVEAGKILFNDVQLNFQEFCQSIKIVKIGQSMIQLTSLFKVSIFFLMFNINVEHLENNFHKQQFVIETSSQVPIGKGLGSSASFNSVLAASLLIITGIITKQQIKSGIQYKTVVNCLSSIFEKVEHGKPSGIDNFVSIYGGIVLYNRSKNPAFKQIQNQKIANYFQKNLCIGFIDSEIEKNTKAAVSKVLQKYNLHLQGQYKYKQIIQQIGKFSTKIIQLIQQSAPNHEQQMRNQLFSILALNHQYLKEFDLSHQFIEEIVNKCTVTGQSVAKITGAGMGGVVLILCLNQFLLEIQKTQNKPIILSKINTKGLQIQFY